MPGYSLNLIQCKSGAWNFVGSVPVKLALIHKTGEELTGEEAERVRYMASPGMCGFTTRHWDNLEDAQQALIDTGEERLPDNRIHFYKG